jgi:hypothetical protein
MACRRSVAGKAFSIVERPESVGDVEALHRPGELFGRCEQAPMNAVGLLPPGAAAAGAPVLDQVAALAVVVGEGEDEPVAEHLAQGCALVGEAFHLARAAGSENGHRQCLARVEGLPCRGQDRDIALALDKQARQRRRVRALEQRRQFVALVFEGGDLPARFDQGAADHVEMCRVFEPRRIEGDTMKSGSAFSTNDGRRASSSLTFSSS